MLITYNGQHQFIGGGVKISVTYIGEIPGRIPTWPPAFFDLGGEPMRHIDRAGVAAPTEVALHSRYLSTIIQTAVQRILLPGTTFHDTVHKCFKQHRTYGWLRAVLAFSVSGAKIGINPAFEILVCIAMALAYANPCYERVHE
jgi:hypothetical protein